MKTRGRALVLCAPSPHLLATASVHSAKLIGAMLDNGWAVDVVGWSPQRGFKVDPCFFNLVKGAFLYECGSWAGRPWLWVPSAVLQSIRLAKRHSYDFMISIAHLQWTHVVAQYVHARARLPLIAFYSDPWISNPLLKMGRMRYMVEHRWERKLLRVADAIVFTNQKLAQWAVAPHAVACDLLEKVKIIPYFYDRSLYPKATRASNGKFVIRHLGQVPRNPYCAGLFKALGLLRKKEPKLAARVVFELYGRFPHGLIEQVEQQGVQEQVRLISDGSVIHIPYDQTLRLMCEADALLFIGIDPGLWRGWGNTVLHVKIPDYLGADRPILAFAGEGSVTYDLLKDVNGMCTDAEPEGILRVLEDFLLQPQKPSREIAEMFDREKIFPLWGEVFESV